MMWQDELGRWHIVNYNKVVQHTRLLPHDEEWRTRRLRLYQGVAKHAEEHGQTLRARFAQIKFQAQMDGDATPCGDCHPWLRQFAIDLTAMSRLEAADEFIQFVKGCDANILIEPKIADWFCDINVSQMQSLRRGVAIPPLGSVLAEQECVQICIGGLPPAPLFAQPGSDATHRHF